jgi:serine/threonine protein kinase
MNRLQALLHFRHPNISLLFGYALSDSSRKGHYLLYEYASKGSLDKIWKSELGRERLSYFHRRAQIALDAFIGLRFLHVGNRYVKPSFHRDIKSANIVLKEDMTGQLIDCGLGTFIQEQASATMMSTGLKGTRGYVCPKYCTGAVSYDASCDIFSFGIVLAELWSGRLQNTRDADGQCYNFFEAYIDEEDDPRHIEDDLDPALGFSSTEGLPDYMYDYKDLALRCMARNPEKRPSGDEVMNRLEKIWQTCKQEVDDENSVFEEERTIADEDAFNESLQSVANLAGGIESACRLCRTYATEVGFEECPLCLALHKQRLRISKAVSSKLNANSAAPANRTFHAMRDENRSLQNIRQEQKDSWLPVLSRMDLRLNNPIPRLFIIVPTDLSKGWKHPKTWLRRRVPTRYSLFFICGHTYKAMKPPISFTASAAWMDKVALSYGVSLTLLQIAARKGFDMNFHLGGAGSTPLTVGPTELSELLTEVKHILDEGDYFDILGRIRSGTRLTDGDIQALNGETYELIVERAREDRGWRTVMEPARKGGESNIIWVCDAVIDDPREEYNLVVV